jgi:hypothetical protein
MKKRNVETGLVLGKLRVLGKVKPSDPRVAEAMTPLGYIKHGSLRECHCGACDKIRFISTHILERKDLVSCGCIRIEAAKKNFQASGERLPEQVRQAKRYLREMSRELKLARMRGNISEENRLYNEIVAYRKANLL